MNRVFNSTEHSRRFVLNCESLKIGDMAQYQRESQEFSYNKLCMIQIANSDLLMTYLGGADYFSQLSKVADEIHKFISEHHIDNIIHPYVMDNATFLIAGEPEITGEFFTLNMHNLYKSFRNLVLLEIDIPVLFRFSVVTDRHHMLEHAIEGLREKRNEQKSYIICDNKPTALDNTVHELRMIGVIQWALRNNGVVPFYQGLYDNKRGGIDKYESLMRIVDDKGVVYLPTDFMDIAKKHHIYSKLSEAMIRRVLREIEDKPIAVSINLSAYDINSNDFRNFIFEMLERRMSKELLVFEILEDEVFENPEILRDFVSNVKRFGAKIAIDDFGSGYSNLLELAQITPEYLKIDGGIVVRMNDCPRSKGVFESVMYLAKKIKTKTVAEHVESIELQRCVEEYGVDFSQGYCMSRPMPMSVLQPLLQKNKEVVI